MSYEVGLNWNFYRKLNLYEFWSIESNFRSIELGKFCPINPAITRFQFTLNHTLSKSKLRLYILFMVCQHNTYWISNTLVHKVLEPNRIALRNLWKSYWGKSLSHRALNQGYWWSSMQKEAQDYIKKCDQCQRFAPNIHQPRGVLNPLSSPWPFAQWKLDIVGPFPRAVGKWRWFLVGTDYFTK